MKWKTLVLTSGWGWLKGKTLGRMGLGEHVEGIWLDGGEM